VNPNSVEFAVAKVVDLSHGHMDTGPAMGDTEMDDGQLTPERFGAAFLEFLEAVGSHGPATSTRLADRVRKHLRGNLDSLQLMSERIDAFDHPNVQVALNDYLAEVDPGATIIGVAGEQKLYVASILSELLGQADSPGSMARRFAEGPVEHVNFHLASDRVLSCIQVGIILIDAGGTPLVVAIMGPSPMRGPREQVYLEASSPDADLTRRFLSDIRGRMQRLNVYRGHVLSLRPGRLDMGSQTLVHFHDLPPVNRDDLVLPEQLLERIERQAIVFSRHADALQAAGRSLKRGLLLYGPPGTGKTFTLMYLIGQMRGRTILLMSGNGIGLLGAVMQMARTLAPSMVVIEDVDIIAEERGNPFSPAGGLLFELLNEMDGLAADVDVVFALTTNRPEVLEPALAARPGRVDLAAEIPLPDTEARRRLLDLYARGLVLANVDLDEIAGETDGASPAYIKELLRRAAVLAACDGDTLIVSQDHLRRAEGELSESGPFGRRLLGFKTDEAGGPVPGPGGFPRGPVHLQ
jgi:hypothetical protein